MRVERIELLNFRNYQEVEFAFPAQGALLIGPNGGGKTNLLEAIAYNSLGKSFRYQSDDLLLRYDQKNFSLVTDSQLRTGSCRIQSIYLEGKKRISINSIPVKHLSQVYEFLKVIYCSPEDVYLVNGSPRKRRQYFDLAIAQLNPIYIQMLRNYIHIVEQRNILLKDTSNTKQKKHWDDLFIQAAIPVLLTRMEYVGKLLTKINQLYQQRLAEAAILDIRYEPSLNPADLEKDESGFHRELRRLETKEWQYQRTLTGPHLDDYEITMHGRMVKDIGSQGQKRTITLLLKIAHLEMIREAIGEYPVLLLDDVFAELDSSHTARFMDILSSHEQIFVASPNPQIAENWSDLPVININDGASTR